MLLSLVPQSQPIPQYCPFCAVNWFHALKLTLKPPHSAEMDSTDKVTVEPAPTSVRDYSRSSHDDSAKWQLIRLKRTSSSPMVAQI